MERVYCLITGYLLGCFLTAQVVSLMYTGKNVKENGMENPGMASVAGMLGFKAGLIVLSGDLVKVFVAVSICHKLFTAAIGKLAVAYAGFGAELGHCFPVTRRFHGGKGVASAGAYSLCISPIIAFLTYIMGAVAVIISGYLPIGSAVIALLFPVLVCMFGYGAEMTALAALTGSIILYKHFPNFRRMKKGIEWKFEIKKYLKR